MKTNLLLLNRTFLLGSAFLLSSLIGLSQNVNIPDANFKNYLLSVGYINTNADAEIQTTEAAAFAGTINVSTLNISDLTGIEAFTALIELECSGNQLTSLNVSANTALAGLNSSDNQLTSLNVSANTALTYLYCSFNPLTSLNVSANTALTVLACSSNQLTSLNVSANTALTYLDCYNNQLTSLNVSTNTALTNLVCYYNQLTSLNVSANTALTDLGCKNNQLTSLNVSANTALAGLVCSNNQLTSLNVQNGNNTNFAAFIASNNPNLTCIQVDNAAWSTANWMAPIEIDATASFSVACTVGIDDIINNPAFAIYPNPSNEQLFIELTDYKNTIAEIFNLQGQLLQRIPLQSSKTTIQISNLTSGSYLFKVKSPEGTIVKKLIKK